jgi:hypothetical protein
MPEFDRVTREHAEIVFTGNNTLLGQEGEIIDTLEYGSLTYNFTLGAVTGTLVVAIEQSDYADGSTAAAVPAAELIAADGSTGAAFVGGTAASTGAQAIGDVGKKRYRVLTIGTDGGTGAIGCVAVLGHPRVSPTE